MTRANAVHVFVLSVLAITLAFAADAPRNGDESSNTAPRLIVASARLDGSVAFLPDGKHLVTAGGFGDDSRTVLLWDVGTGKLIRRIGHHEERIAGLACTPDGSQVLTLSHDETMRLWDVVTGKEIRRFELSRDIPPAATKPAISGDGRLVAATDGYSEVGVWEITTGRKLFAIDADGSVNAVAFSPDGNLLGIADRGMALCDARSGTVVRRVAVHCRDVRALAFSPDGRRIVFGDWEGTTRICDLGSGKVTVSMLSGDRGVNRVAFDSNSDAVWTATRAEACLWNAGTGKLIRRLKARDFLEVGSEVVCFSPDGRLLAVGCESQTLVMRTADGEEICRLDSGSLSRSNKFTQLSRDGRFLLTATPTYASLWETTTGKVRRLDMSPTKFSIDKIDAMALSPAGDRLIFVGDLGGFAVIASKMRELKEHRPSRRSVKRVEMFDWVSEELTDLFELENTPFVEALAFSPDGRQCIVGGWNHTQATLWDLGTRKQVKRFGNPPIPDNDAEAKSHVLKTYLPVVLGTIADLVQGKVPRPRRAMHGGTCELVVMADNGHRLLTMTQKTSLEREVWIWDVNTGDEICCLHRQARVGSGVINDADVLCAALSSDGRYAATGHRDGKVLIWNASTGAEVCSYAENESNTVETIAFSPDGKRVLSGGYSQSVCVYDICSKQVSGVLQGHTAPLKHVAFSTDGKQMWTAGEDGEVRLWDSRSLAELCRLVSFQNGGWAVIDPDGRYDACNGGDVQGLYWEIGEERVALSQLKERYYEPNLFAKVIGLNKEPVRDVSRFENPKLYPELDITRPTGDRPLVGIHLGNRGGGIGRVVVKINGKELTADARGQEFDPESEEAFLEVDVSNDPRLKPGEENVIEVQAFNGEGYLRHGGLRFIFIPPGKAEEREPHVWAIVAGVSDYRGDQIDLRYASKDAEDFGNALQIAAEGLFGPKNVHMSVFSCAPENGHRQATRENIVRAFEAARQAKPQDILVVYLAGHGVNYGGQDGDFYYLVSDARTANLSDPEVRCLTALSSGEVTELIKAIPAEKQVMVFDTCSAGRVIESLTEARHLPSSQIRALERLKDRTGIHVLAGCAADAVSYETSRYGQGLLTHSLLLGMRGAALREDEYVDVGKLFNFAADKVPGLAKNIGGIQRPKIAVPVGGASFDIGRLTSEEKLKIPLESPHSMVLRCYFGDSRRRLDRLGLTKRVNDVLRDRCIRGGEGALVFVDADEFPDAYQVAGDYTVENDLAIVRIFLGRGTQDVAEFEIKGDAGRLDELAAVITEEVHRKVSALDNP